ncbi:MAG: hypothetical protein M1816_004385 [Peltula sp. TS41687]|nr:MAG: hypothetical protein M1816_004385 [Peltula sp. TS41687]
MPRPTRLTRASEAKSSTISDPYTRSSTDTDHATRVSVSSDVVGGEKAIGSHSKVGSQGPISITDIQMIDVKSSMSGSGSANQHSERLPIVDPKWKAKVKTALGRGKRSSYAILWEPGHDKFVNALRAQYDINDEEALPYVEGHAYSATLGGSCPVERLTGVDDKAKATRRGGHRAILQTALRTLATNEEQSHRGGSWPPLVESAPQPPSNQQWKPPPTPSTSEPSSRDPFFYTKCYLEFRNQQRLFEQLAISDETSAEWAHEGQRIFAKPFATASIIKERMAKSAGFLSSVLLALSGGDDVTRFAALSPDLPPEEKPWQQRALLIKSIQAEAPGHVGPECPTTTLPDLDELRTLQEMTQVHLSQASRKELRQFGRKFGGLYQKLMQQLQSIDQTLEARSALLQKARGALKERRHAMGASFQCSTLVELAKPLHTGRDKLNCKTAARLFQSRIAEECHQGARAATTDHRQLWSFSASIPAEIKRRQWFSLEKCSGRGSANHVIWPNQSSVPISLDVPEMGNPVPHDTPQRDSGQAIPTEPVPAAGLGVLMPNEILNWTG